MRVLRILIATSASLFMLGGYVSAQTISAPEPGRSIQLIEDLVVGESEAAGAPLFRRVGDVGVDAGGRMYILDVFASTVHVVDREGHASRRIGEAGAGPGELSNAHHMLMAGDSILVFQQGGKVSVFDRHSGAYRRQYALPVTAPDFVSQPLAVDGDQLLARTSNDVVMSVDEPRKPDRLLGLSLTTDETRTHSKMPGRDIIVSVGAGGRAEALASAPFPRRTLCARANRRVYCGWTGSKQLIVFGLNGQVLDSIDVDFPDVHVTAADRAPWLDRYANTGFLETLEFPEVHPYYDALVGDDDGRLWFRVRSSRETGRTTLWVIDPVERAARAATVEGYVEPGVVKNGMLYGRRLDGDGVEALVRYRLEF